MGQYYVPSIIKKNFNKSTKNPVIASLCSWHLMIGAKLMEHSYVGNEFVKSAMQLIAKYKAHPFVWCGDYADERFTNNNGDKYNVYDLEHYMTPDELQKIVKENNIEEDYKYIVNYTKRQYIKVPDFKEDEWTIHPLPLLCADGNGRGGGDYRGKNMDKVGIWAYDRIGVTNKRPHYKRIEVDFRENG